jgi:integrase
LDKVPVNVAMRVRPLPENPPRQRVLDDDELGRALEAVASLTDPYVRLAFILLIETGARLSEVLHARWADIDLEGKLWRLPSPKSGKPQVIPLPDSTCAAIRNVARLGPYVIPGQSGNAPRSDLKRPWNLIRESAELSDCNIHDLRRSFGLRVARAAGLHVASKLLRHSTVRVTESVYAPLGIDELRKASNKAARVVGKVLTMHRKKKAGGGRGNKPHTKGMDEGQRRGRLKHLSRRHKLGLTSPIGDRPVSEGNGSGRPPGQ